VEYPKEIFKAYDIRGIVGRPSPPNRRSHRPRHWLRAVARGQKESASAATVACRAPISLPRWRAAFARPASRGGPGMVATPMTYFAAYQLGTTAR